VSEEAQAVAAAAQQRRAEALAGGPIAGGGGPPPQQEQDVVRTATQQPPAPAPAPTPAPAASLVIVADFTVLSDGAIHNKFDKNAVNDPDAKRELGKQIEKDFLRYRDDESLLGSGAVRLCEESAWKETVQRLRDEQPGHFFAPVFPP
jgi:hypothetical protein